MAAAMSAADRSVDLVISFSIWQTHYSGYLITRLAFEPRYSQTFSFFRMRNQIPPHQTLSIRAETEWVNLVALVACRPLPVVS